MFWPACNKLGWPFGPPFKLLLLTAQRREEVAGMRWSEIDLDKRTWTVPRERVKNDKAHIVHLSDAAAGIIEALSKIDHRLVFTARGSGKPVSGFGHAKARLNQIMTKLSAETGTEPIPRFTIHGLRRTAATGMAAINIPHHVVDKVLSHTAGNISGVAAVYNRFDYLDERRTAPNAWAHHVEQLVDPTDADNVVSLRA